jgi:branched-subunit amino acid transport protein
MSIWLLVLGMALISLGTRLPVFLLGDRIRFPPIVERALAYVPVAVLTAITVSTVLAPPGEATGLDWRNPFLLPALVTFAVSWSGRSLLTTICVGMGAYLVWRSVLGPAL